MSLVIAAGWFIIAPMIRETASDPPDLTVEEVADVDVGSARKAAVLKKVMPGLKAALAEMDIAWGSPVFLRAFKEERILEVWLQKKGGNYELFRTYAIAAASGKLGPKLAEGDRQVPEGFYRVPPSQMNPRSDFHLSFNIGYPNEYDRAHDRTGTFIMVHGSNVSIGCLAMTDEKIEEIFTLCDAAHGKGQEFFGIHLFPFRMTPEKMASHEGEQWDSFWENLRTGYDWFEEKRVPPEVSVKDELYHFQ